MILTALDDSDTLERQNAKLIAINTVLMRRVEQDTDASGAAYAHFERAALLEDEVRARTSDLARALDLLNESNAKLAEANQDAQAARSNLATAIETLREGFALFDDNDELVMCNSRFGDLTPDVKPFLRPGLTFAEYTEQVSESGSLSLPPGVTPAMWAAQRAARHKDRQVMFNVTLTGGRHVQVSEHRTPANGTVIIQTDVTDIVRLHRAERARMIDDQAEITRATLEHMTEGVCLFDANARLLSWNGRVAELLPIALNHLVVGRSLSVLFSGLTAGGVGPLSPLIRWADDPQPRCPFEFEVENGGGRTLRVLAQTIPRGIVVSFVDVTAEREALRVISATNELLEQRVLERTLDLQDAVSSAERANATKSRFVAAASHDLQQPLSAAKLYLSALEDAQDVEACRAIVEKAQQALGSVDAILGALLDISRLESRAHAFDVTDVAVGPILRRLEDDFQPLADEKGLALTVMPSSAVVRSDPVYLRRILQNLISNAIKYTETGRVLVGLVRRGSSVRLCVLDTGPGIPEAEQDNIFKEFARVDGHASASAGMGLGLAIVDRACALLNHPLDLRSEVGRGTAFVVTVPLAQGAD